MTYPTITLTPSTPPRGKLGGTDRNIPILSFVPPLEGVWDIHIPGDTPAAKAEWLRQLAEVSDSLAIQVERHAAKAVSL